MIFCICFGVTYGRFSIISCVASSIYPSGQVCEKSVFFSNSAPIVEFFFVESFNNFFVLKGTNPALKKSSNIPEIYAKMFGRFH